ncbi:MAG: glycosyltransferase family 4 protein [Desulfurococcaceae archaeon]
MKVIILGDYYPDIGGVTSYIHTLVRALLRRGHSVVILQTRPHIRPHIIISDNLALYRLPYRSRDKIKLVLLGLRHTWLLLKTTPLLIIEPRALFSAIILAPMIDSIIAKECDKNTCIIHSNHLALRSLVAATIGMKRGLRVVVSTHGYDTSYPKSLKEYVTRKKIIDLADKVIVLTQVKKIFLKELYSYEEKYIVIPNFVECLDIMNKSFEIINNEKHMSKKTRGLENRLVIGYVGRILSEKGIFDIIEAVHSIEESLRNNIFVVFIGGGPDERRLHDEVNTRKLSNIVLTGPLTDKEKNSWMRTIDILLLPTRWPEGFPTVILEAWSSGAIPIVYPFPGASEIVRKNMGFTVNSVEELSKMVKKLVGEYSYVETLRRNIIENLRHSNYCVEKTIKDIEELYNVVSRFHRR